MASLGQDALRAAWLDAPLGQMSALSQAKAWALRETWRAVAKHEHGMLAHIAGKVAKEGGGNPSPQALGQLFAKIDSDDSWFPGKQSSTTRGRKRALTPTKAASIARCAMTMKGNGLEPTYARLVTACPQAVVNDDTGEAVNKHAVYTLLRERCHDGNPEEKWEHQSRLTRTGLPPLVMGRRLAWGLYIRDEVRHTGAWYFKRCVWTDICNKILPRTQQKANKMILARKGGKGWMSNDAKHYSRNLRADSSVLKQNSWDTVRVWWAPVLMRGKLHVEVLGPDFPGDCPQGAALLVARVRSAINVRFHAEDKPDLVFTDRGRGFYAIKTGRITSEYKEALRENGLRAFMGEDASRQPGDLQDLMLHETAVAWISARLQLTTPKNEWEETVDAFAARLKAACQHANENYELGSLCKQLPSRVADLLEEEGGRIGK